jgi:hypothetical protein
MKAMMCRKWWMLGVRKMIRLEDRKAGKGAATRRELSVYRSTAVNLTTLRSFSFWQCVQRSPRILAPRSPRDRHLGEGLHRAW